MLVYMKRFLLISIVLVSALVCSCNKKENPFEGHEIEYQTYYAITGTQMTGDLETIDPSGAAALKDEIAQITIVRKYSLKEGENFDEACKNADLAMAGQLVADAVEISAKLAAIKDKVATGTGYGTCAFKLYGIKLIQQRMIGEDTLLNEVAIDDIIYGSMPQ